MNLVEGVIMIIYFSATGNCRYVAERLGSAFEDTAVSIEKSGNEIILADNEILGIVTPVYCWELPIIVRDFLKKMKITADGEHYSFIVVTYGTTPGCTYSDAKRLLLKKGVELSGGFSIRMPDTWTPVFDLSDPEEVKKQNADAELQIGAVIEEIKNKTAGNRMQNKKPYPVRFFSDLYYNRARKTKKLYVEDTCIGCGRCAAKCPMRAIEIREKRPVWIKDKCALCFRCLHNCPEFAIQYGNGSTKKHGQYRNPNVGTD